MKENLIDLCADVHQAYLDADYSSLEAMSATFDFLAYRLQPIHRNAIDDYWSGYLDAYDDIRSQLFDEAVSVSMHAPANRSQKVLKGAAKWFMEQ